WGAYFGAAGDGHDVSGRVRGDHRQQGRVAAVNLVSGAPASRVAIKIDGSRRIPATAVRDFVLGQIEEAA
ncbi:hypothetical protein ACFTUH_10425, partial [Streptomyces coelicoflavus]